MPAGVSSALKKLVALPFLLTSFSSAALPVNPVHVVFRADDRPLAEIQEAGGMRPWADGMADDNLLHHFEGESVEGHTSNFVSTTSSLSAAIEHAASLARPNSEEPFDTDFVTYIYQVRPDHDFYDVEASLAHARDAASPGSMRRARLESIIRDYAGMDELVAHRGFSHERIIAYAELTGTLLQRFGVAAGSPLFSPTFWSHRWIANANYRPAYDADTSNLDVYLNVGDPRGYRDMVANQTQVAVPMVFTCEGVRSDGNVGTQRKRRHAVRAVCASHEYMGTARSSHDAKASVHSVMASWLAEPTRVFYDKSLLEAIVHDEL